MQHRNVAGSVSLKLRMPWGCRLGTTTVSPAPAMQLFGRPVGLRVELKALEAAAQDVHRLDVEMAVDGDLALGLRGEQAQAVLGIARAVVPPNFDSQRTLMPLTSSGLPLYGKVLIVTSSTFFHLTSSMREFLSMGFIELAEFIGIRGGGQAGWWIGGQEQGFGFRKTSASLSTIIFPPTLNP